IDKRINFLSKRLENAEVIEPASVSSDNIKFGATVTIEEEGEKKVVSIVGIDESDVKSGLISWVSPLGKSLLGKNEGDIASFQTPNGEREIEVIKIEYIDINFE
ncbi:MAG: GreA/GreB family elongation factor, partial [Bdellovibrionota bacterium]|nr:GreA/GreB family elongation factor [Bdellovibrionota bacterium]